MMNIQCLLSNTDSTSNNCYATNFILVSDACEKIGASH